MSTIRTVRIYITPGCPTGCYTVDEEYPVMQTLYTGDDLYKVIEAIQMDSGDTVPGTSDLREQPPAMMFRAMANRSGRS